MLYTAHRLVEQLTADRDLVHLRDRLAPEVAEMIYYGFWYCPKMDTLLAFIREAQKNVTGSVTLELYKGNVSVVSRTSPVSLYDAGIAHEYRLVRGANHVGRSLAPRFTDGLDFLARVLRDPWSDDPAVAAFLAEIESSQPLA